MKTSLGQIFRWTLGALGALLAAAVLIWEGWVFGSLTPNATMSPRNEAVRAALVNAPVVAPLLVQLKVLLDRR